MGNRAVITTPERKVGIYLHWNGGRDTIEPLLKYCELQGYRPPSSDEYGFARICQVMGNFFGGSTSLGVGAYTTDRQMDPGDNGIYVIEGWHIADHLRTEYDSNWNPVGMRSFGPSEEEDWHKFDDMLRAFDASMPEKLRLGELLDSVEVPAGELPFSTEGYFPMATLPDGRVLFLDRNYKWDEDDPTNMWVVAEGTKFHYVPAARQ